MEKKSMHESILNVNDRVESFCDENWMENHKGEEWNISSKTHGLEF